MRTPAIARPSTAPVARWLASALLCLAWLLPGCATRQDVAQIVAQSNAAIVASQFGGLPEPRSGTNGPPWQEASDRIETFIAAHPDQAATVAPLRVRQAMLLLSHRQFNLAEAAFNAAVLEDLHTDRDRALKRNQDTLLWWFAASTNDTWTAADQTKAQAALRTLQEEQAGLGASPEIRDYLAEMRAWIGLAAAKQTTSAERARELLEDALDVYGESFSAPDLVILAEDREQLADPQALGPDIRRRLRAKAVLNQARKHNQDDTLEAHPRTATFDRIISR